jgi:hypothetical protein
VVASVDVPNTTKDPDEVDTSRLDVKFVFSAHDVPFQYRVLFCNVPDAIFPPPEELTLIHFVDVPVEDNTCPETPGEPNPSTKSWLRVNVPPTVVVASVLVPETLKGPPMRVVPPRVVFVRTGFKRDKLFVFNCVEGIVNCGDAPVNV